MVSDAHRRRLAALEQKAAPAATSERDLALAAQQAAVSRILEIARAWEKEVNDALPYCSKDRRTWLEPTPDLFERMTPEDQKVFRAIVEVCGTF